MGNLLNVSVDLLLLFQSMVKLFSYVKIYSVTRLHSTPNMQIIIYLKRHKVTITEQL